MVNIVQQPISIHRSSNRNLDAVITYLVWYYYWYLKVITSEILVSYWHYRLWFLFIWSSGNQFWDDFNWTIDISGLPRRRRKQDTQRVMEMMMNRFYKTTHLVFLNFNQSERTEPFCFCKNWFRYFIFTRAGPHMDFPTQP